MRVKITFPHGYHNPRRGIELACGEVANVSEDLATKLLNAGLAVLAPAVKRTPKPVETTALAPSENTLKHTSKPPARRPAGKPRKED